MSIALIAKKSVRSCQRQPSLPVFDFLAPSFIFWVPNVRKAHIGTAAAAASVDHESEIKSHGTNNSPLRRRPLNEEQKRFLDSAVGLSLIVYSL